MTLHARREPSGGSRQGRGPRPTPRPLVRPNEVVDTAQERGGSVLLEAAQAAGTVATPESGPWVDPSAVDSAVTLALSTPLAEEMGAAAHGGAAAVVAGAGVEADAEVAAGTVVEADAELATEEGATATGTTEEAEVETQGSQGASTGAVDALLEADWGERSFGRENATEAETELLQRTLVALGYLPADSTIDGAFGPNTANALMAFQVNTSGVDTIATGTDSEGQPTYAADGDASRLRGVVDGVVGPTTRERLQAALAAERARLVSGEEEAAGPVREMGDTDEQRAAIAGRLAEQGHTPETVMSVDLSAFDTLGLRPHVLDAAVDAWENQFASGTVTNTVITVNDFELPDNMRRSFTIDLATGELVDTDVMAHGRGSGTGAWATDFDESNTVVAGSNAEGFNQSILGGMMVGAETYYGGMRHGLVVEGFETGINDNAEERLIRTHAPSNIGRLAESGVIGLQSGYRSYGCMVMSENEAARYRQETLAEGGRFNFNFAPHSFYWGRDNDVNRD